MKILVTGGAGYIGSVLVGELLNKGHHVTVLDNLMYGQATALTEYCRRLMFEFVRGDARDVRALGDAHVTTADVVIPLAAIVGAPACSMNTEAHSVNVGAIDTLTTIIAGGSRVRRVPRHTQQLVIYPTTNSGYGVGQAGVECTEETPLQPISDYGRQKVRAENMVLLKLENAISLRLATVFGLSPRMRLDLLVNDFVYRAVHDRFVVLFEANFKRNYVHVRDVASAIRFGIDHPGKMVGQAYNVGLSNANLSKLELCRRIQQHVPEFVYPLAPIGEDPDKRDYVVSNAKIEALGWAPAHTLDDGIRELIKGYRMLKRMEFANA